MSLDRRDSEAAERCRFCPKLCSAACPVAHESAREVHTPWGNMSLVAERLAPGALSSSLPGPLQLLAKRARALVDDGTSLPLDADAAESLYACTGCLRCRTSCEHDTDVPRTLFAARAVAVERGLAPAGAQAMAERVARQGHPRSGDLQEALARVSQGADPAPAAGSSVLFAGCVAPIDAPESISAALRAARGLSAPLSLAREPPCCGRSLYEGGFRESFRAQVEKAWNVLGDREVVVLSAACGRALTEWAREVGVEPRGPVVHVTTHLARRLGPSVQGRPVPGKVAYHDPCHLGRGSGEYDAPRRLLDVVLQDGLLEPVATSETAGCCGAAGLLPETFPDVARTMAMSLGDELRATGASKVATACPSCRLALSAAGLEVVDVVDLVAAWLDGNPSKELA